MAAAWTKKNSTPNRLLYLVVGDGTVAATRTSAQMLADADAGPLKDLLNATYADQAAMRAALLEAHVRVTVRPRLVSGVATTTVGGYSADVDTDAVTPTKPEVNVQMNDTTGDEVYVELEYVPTPFY
jgi:hypothetical protein